MLKEMKSNKFWQGTWKVITNNLSTTEILLELGLKDKIAGMLNPDNAVTDKYKDAIATIPQIGDKKNSLTRDSPFLWARRCDGSKYDVFWKILGGS